MRDRKEYEVSVKILPSTLAALREAKEESKVPYKYIIDAALLVYLPTRKKQLQRGRK